MCRLEKFLQGVMDIDVYRNNRNTLHFLEKSSLSFRKDLGGKERENEVRYTFLSIHIFISNSVEPSACDFGQKLNNSLATAQTQILLSLSKQLIFVKSCKNKL